MGRPIILGAVLYDPKVSVIWDIIREYFEASGCPMDVVFYTNYELQVGSLLKGHIDVAWNSPLAWVDAQRRAGGRCRAIGMRDTDRDRRSHVIAPAGADIAAIGDLEGRTIAFGAKDSPQATLIPKEHLRRNGLGEENYVTQRFDVLVGKHGDHIGGELDAFRALEQGEVAASCLLDLNWDTWTKDGTVDPGRYRIVTTTDRFDHCVFTVAESFPAERQSAFEKTLFSMDYGNPDHREMMDLEGLKKWEPGRTSGFELLTSACKHQRFFA
jgi:ABC-type phosphate/phosphonate transport system substrate-binding protein